MIKLKIKPLSVNQCWQGKRFKTPKYKAYEKELLLRLPKITIPPPPYEVNYYFGFSSANCDLDNPVKPLQDILQKKYGINDRYINKMTVEKVKVAKCAEYFGFEINNFKNETILEQSNDITDCLIVSCCKRGPITDEKFCPYCGKIIIKQ